MRCNVCGCDEPDETMTAASPDPADLAELRGLVDLAEKATAGPWVQLDGWPRKIIEAREQGRGIGGSIDPARDRENFAHPIASIELAEPVGDFDPARDGFEHRRCDGAQANADAAFIVAARNAMGALRRVVGG